MHSQEDSDSEPDLNKLAPQQEIVVKVEQKSKIEPINHFSLNAGKEKRPRLIIDHMVLQDFKSYAGRQIIGKFHGNFTSVVGPNGSGKSNLIESMLFIFGFNASWMRLNKLSQLIHNSSTSSGNSRAAVEVHFKKLQELNDGSLVQLQGYDLVIRRTVNTSNVSKYFLQGKQSTQAEVKERLKAEGIDLGNNRFLILQGEVEQISQMKQKSGDKEKPGLLQYLEDIIGSSQFIERIQECGHEFAQTEEQKHEKGQLMRLVENQLKGMSKAKEEAVKYVKKERKVYQFQNVFNQVMVATAKEEMKKKKESLIQIERTRDRVMAQERQKLKKQSQRIRDIKKNKNEIEEIQKNLDKCQEMCAKLQIDDKHITQEISFKSEDLVRYERKMQDSDKEMTKIIVNCEEIRDRMPKNKEILNEKTSKVEEMRVELAKYEKPELRQNIKACEIEISKNELELGNYRNKLENAMENIQKQKLGKNQLELKIKDYQSKHKANSEIRDKIEKAKTIAEKIIKEKRQKVGEYGSKRDNLRNEIRRIQTELKEQLNDTQEQGHIGNMFREIMQQGFPGVLGRLGDLGSTTKEFDEIISTCCSKMDNIVVTDLQTAQAVLDYLKKKKLGRATCIIMDKINDHRQYMNRPFQNLQRATRLFDAIKFKTEEAKLAFYFALGDTLYCQDIDLGMEYAMKNENQRRRVISRNKARGGYMICQINGLMVGSMPRRGGFDPKAAIKTKGKGKDENYSKAMETKRKELNLQLEQTIKRLQAQQNQSKIAQQDLQQMKRQLISVTDSIKQFEEEVRDLKGLISKADSTINPSTNSQREVEAITQQLGILNQKNDTLKENLKALELQQRKGETEKINNLRQIYKKDKTVLTGLQKDFQKEKAILQNSLKRIEDIKKGKTESERTLEKLKREIDKLKVDQLDLEKRVTEIIGKMTAYEERIKQCKKVESELKMIMEEDEKQVKESKIKVEKVKRDVDVCQESCRRQAEDIKFSESELDRIRQNYREITASYSFLEDLEEIDKMSIAADKTFNDPPSPKNSSSILQTSMLNSSFDSNQSKVFQVEKIVKTEPFHNFSEDLLESFTFFRDKISGIITSQVAALKKMEGSNLEIINQYRLKYTHYRERLRQFEAVKERQQELKRIIDSLKQDRLEMFRQGFGIINAKLKEVYQHLTRGGDAQLELIDALDPFSDGVNFSVRPPKKSWKQVNKLSGGEKTLSSLSLIFALHYYKPTPLYFMDEIDAALDFKNVSIVAEYIKKRTKDAQFIIISLRNNMFDLANKLVGVYKTNDKTRVINLEPAKLLKQRQERQKQNIENRTNTNSAQ